jgi:hypothetical protein
VSIEEALSETAGDGEIVSGYVAFVEIANADDTFSIKVFADGQSSIWKLEGLVNYAIANGYLDPDDEEDDDAY